MLNKKQRLDQELTRRGLTPTRSQSESWIKMGKVTVDGRVATKPGLAVSEASKIELITDEQYVSRAGLKLASVAKILNLDFKDKIVLDVGSSTGGFTDYALQHGAKKVYAVDVGTDQLHPSLHGHPRIELHEKTDIRDFKMSETPDVVVIDVSFISLQAILPAVTRLCGPQTVIAAMAKPQFEADAKEVSKGVIKNDTMRRNILKRLEQFLREHFVIVDKADSEVAGAKGNRERFYKLVRS
jgi:23S rRNA (cytidine1920-2'-O)/16S rRNA (cytidine1409-2'-O)-methyltransferase